MKSINMQDGRYVQRSNLDRLETNSEVTEPKRVASDSKSTIGRLFVLELSSGQIFSLNADGSALLKINHITRRKILKAS